MKNQKKSGLKNINKNILLILGLIYILITILAATSYISTMSNISTTPITFGSVIGAMWWQLLMIALFIITYILYVKNEKIGVLFQIIMGMSMLAYILVSVVAIGANVLAITIELIYPLILITHGLITLLNIKRKKLTD